MDVTTITIIKEPTKVEFECPNCGRFIKVSYNGFCSMMSSDEPIDWTSFECPNCYNEITIGYLDWV